MTTEEKMMHMFVAVHGEATCSCYWELQYAEESCEATSIACMKDGLVCWDVSKADILFDYVTRGL